MEWVGMNKKAFADLMLKWATLKEQMNDIEDAITKEVMGMQESVAIGYAKATYSAGRATYAWEKTALENNASKESIEYYSTVKVTVKWKEVCRDMRIVDAPILKAGTPKVTIELVK